MKKRMPNLRHLYRPAIVLVGALAFLALFWRSYQAGGGTTGWPIALAAAGLAVLSALLIVATVIGQREARPVRRQPAAEPVRRKEVAR